MDKSQVQVGDIFPTNQGCTVVVLFIGNNGKFLVEFRDQARYQCFVGFNDLLSGNVENPYAKIFHGVGYLGEGRYKIKDNPSDKHESLEFTVWLDLLSGLAMVTTITDTSFRPEWYNFQKFAEWYINSEFYAVGYKIDENKKWSLK